MILLIDSLLISLVADFWIYNSSSKIFLCLVIRFFIQATLFYTSNAFFSTQPLVLLNFLWAELQILLRCCFIRLSIHHNDILFTFNIIVSILGLGLFLSYLCDLFFIFIFISTLYNHCLKSAQNMEFFLVRIFPHLDWIRARKNSVFVFIISFLSH